MNRKNTYSIKLYFLLPFIIGLLLSCKQEEFQVPEDGRPVPYIDSINTTIQLFIKQNTSERFQALWNKANMDFYLNSLDTDAKQYTVLIPSDAQLDASGLSLQKVQNSTEEAARELLFPHILIGTTKFDVLQARRNHTQMESLYTYADLFIQRRNDHLNKGLLPLKLSISLAFQDNALFLNGKKVGDTKPVELMDGYVFKIDTLIHPVKFTAWEYLKSNPKYSMYTRLLEVTDSMYIELFKSKNGYYPLAGHNLAQLYHRDSKNRYSLHKERHSNGKEYLMDQNTFFIPTNQAFIQAGFYTVEDLVAFNQTRSIPILEWQETIPASAGFYKLVGEFATDSLLDKHHNWGLRYLNDPNYKLMNGIQLFSNDFNDSDFNNFPVAWISKKLYLGGAFIRSDTEFYTMPYVMDSMWIRLKNGTRKIPFGVQDIVTLNGVIHEVNDLFI